VSVLGAGSALPERAVVGQLLREHAPAGWADEARTISSRLNPRE
jgi:hypothetical protein